MECNNAFERQKLVSNNDPEMDEDQNTIITNIMPSSAPKSVQTPISPVLSSKIFSSGETSRSQNSTTCSIGKSNPDNPSSSRLIYVNERKHQESKPKKKVQRGPLLAEQHNPNVSYSFSARALKHHSFISEVPDVRHMEQALLGLLEDFHSGKLKAFGSGCSMEQMTNIREQQEKLAKLHFELISDPINTMNAQDNMSQLVEKLEQLSVSIEKLHSSNLDI